MTLFHFSALMLNFISPLSMNTIIKSSLAAGRLPCLRCTEEDPLHTAIIIISEGDEVLAARRRAVAVEEHHYSRLSQVKSEPRHNLAFTLLPDLAAHIGVYLSLPRVANTWARLFRLRGLGRRRVKDNTWPD